MRFWGPSTKNKDCTIQIDKVKLEEVRFVKLFADTFVKPALEEAFKGNNINHLFKDKTEATTAKDSDSKYKCELCDQSFNEAKTLKMHASRMHKAMTMRQVQLCKSKFRTKCLHCSISFSEEDMIKHVEIIHSCKFCENISRTEIEKKRHMRDKHDNTSASTSPKNKKRKELDSGDPPDVVVTGHAPVQQKQDRAPSKDVISPAPTQQCQASASS